jgi:hypothetical protein
MTSNRLVIAYLALTAVLLALGLPATLPRIAAHGAVIYLILRLQPRPLFLFPLLIPLYSEVETLNRIVSGTFYDAPVQQLEAALFATSPALWLSQQLPYRPLSEWLHLTYLLYYVLLPILVLRLPPDKADKATFLGLGTLFTCFLIQVCFPVQGPRPLWPDIDPSCQGLFWSLTHEVSQRGAVDGAAFPSGHVAFSTAALLAAWRYDRTMFWAYLPITLSIALATVYGRFHYAVDALAGLAVAFLWAWLVGRKS